LPRRPKAIRARPAARPNNAAGAWPEFGEKVTRQNGTQNGT
jgi:hypothetical protein